MRLVFTTLFSLIALHPLFGQSITIGIHHRDTKALRGTEKAILFKDLSVLLRASCVSVVNADDHEAASAASRRIFACREETEG
jgi:hypothetical protein